MKKTIKNMIGSMTAKLAAILLAFGCAGSAWALDTASATVNGVTTTYASLQEALNAAATAASDPTVEVLVGEIDCAGWTPVTINSSSKLVTLDGKGVVLKNLSAPLFRKDGSGCKGVVVKNVTVKDAAISTDSYAAAFLPYADCVETAYFENCHIVDSTITSTGSYAAGFVAYAAGYNNQNDGPVFSTVTIKDCSVKNSTITGANSTGGLMGHATGSAWTLVNVEGTEVAGNTITCTGSSNVKAGSLFGTVGVAGAEDNGRKGGIVVGGDSVVTNNTATSNGVATDRIFGRVGSEGGALAVTGGTYDGTATYANDTYDWSNGKIAISGGSFKTVPSSDAMADGFMVEGTPNAQGFYEVTVDPYAAYTKVADGFYQSAATYTASTDFYITSKAGLEYFRDLVNQVGTVTDTYISTYVTDKTTTTWYQEGVFGDKTVHLLADIDLNNEEWSPIGQPKNAAGDKRYFYGHFNGENHTISNLKATTYVETIKTWYPGLFGFIGSKAGQTFSNLTINNVTLVGYDYAGAIVGNAGSNATAFNNSHVTGNIDIKCMMTGAFVGGIVGIGTSAITDCSVEGSAGSTIEGSTVGGLAGTSTRSANASANTVAGSTVTGVTVNSEDNGGQAGGLVGKATNPVTVTGNTVHDVTVSAENGKADALVGGVGGDVTASSNTTDTNVTVISDPITGSGTAEDPYIIPNLDALKVFRDRVNNGKSYKNKFIKMADNLDIDLASEGSWTPIGKQGAEFQGTFDGNGVIFRNFAINDSSLINAGLFGRMTYANLKNINVVNVNISANERIGTIVGAAQTSTTITNCSVTGTIQISGNHYIGGVAGWSYADTVNCTVDGGSAATSIIHGADLVANSGDGDDIGGIVGFAGEAQNHIAGCTVKNVTIEGFRQVGGIAGIARVGKKIENCKVENAVVKCIADEYTTQNKASKMAFGGIVGVVDPSTGANDAVTISGCEVSGVSLESTETGKAVARMGYVSGGRYNTAEFTITEDDNVSISNTTVENCTRVEGTLSPVNDPGYIDGPYAARIGNVKYDTLAAALADVGENAPLTWASEDAWPSATPVYYNGNFYATLTAAITAANTANASTAALIYVRPNYSAGSGFTADHDNIKTSITIYGNNASLNKSWEPTIEYSGGSYHTLTKDVTFALYNLHDGAGAWGSRTSDFTSTVVMCNCTNAHEVYVGKSSGSGVNNFTVKNSTFAGTGDGSKSHMCAVKSNNPGTVLVEGCAFTGIAGPVNCSNDGPGTQTLTVKDCTFTDCSVAGSNGWDATAATYCAPIRAVAKAGADTTLAVDGCEFVYTGAETASDHNGDILVGETRETSGGAGVVSYTVENTTAKLTVSEAKDKNVPATISSENLVAANSYSGDNAPTVNLGSVTLWVSGSDKWSFSLGFEYTKYDQEDAEEVEDYYNPVVADTTVATITTIDASAMFDGATALGKIHAVAAGETTIECQIADYDEDYNDILVPARFTVVVRAPDPDAPAVLGYSSVGGYTIGFATEDGDTVATLTAEAEAMGLTVVATGTYSEMTNLKDNHVAKIGNVPYLTLSAAVAAASADDTIKLLDDVELDEAVDIGESITLDLDSKTVSISAANEDGYAIGVTNGTVTITGNGTIDAGDDIALYVMDGSVTIANGTFGVVGVDDGSLTITDGTFNGSLLTGGGTTTINGGTFNDVVYVGGGSVTVYGGTFTAADNVLMVTDATGALTVNGGTFTATQSGEGEPIVVYVEGGTASLTAGTFTGGTIATDAAETGTLTVSGGSFSAAVPEEYCASGYIPAAQDPDTGLYSVASGYKVTFANYDGSELFVTNVVVGGTATYEGATPVKPGDATSAYAFSGWDPATIVAVTDAAQTYTAQFAPVAAIAAVFELADGGATTNNYVSYADLHAALEAGKAAGKTVALLADVDLTGVVWTPVGTSASPFRGVIDGNGKVISNLTINDPTLDYAGLIGYGVGEYPQKQVIKDLTISNATVTARMYVGTLGGCMHAEHCISNITVKGLIQVTGNYMVGGVVGQGYVHIYDSEIIGDEGSFVKGLYLGKEGEVVGGVTLPDDCEGDNVGGIVGHVGEGAGIGFFNCSASGLTVMGTRKVGGIAGIVSADNSVRNVNVHDVTIGTTATAEYATAKKSTMEIGGVVGSYHNGAGSATGGDISGVVQDVTIADLPTGVTGTGDGKNISYGLVTGGNRGANPESKVNYAALIAKGYDAEKYNNSYLINNYVATVVDANGDFVGGYGTLSAAFEAAQTGYTVLLQDDQTNVLTKVSLPEGASFDANGYDYAILFGAGTEADPYQIYNLSTLLGFRDDVDFNGNSYSGKYIKLMADIDMGSVENWIPIGLRNYGSKNVNRKLFSGNFDGDGHTISNLTLAKVVLGERCDNATYDGQFATGLFGHLYGGEIKNLTLDGVTQKQGEEWNPTNLGSLIGIPNQTVLVANVVVTNVDLQGASGQRIGGFVGNPISGTLTMTNCHFYGTISYPGAAQVGGLAGGGFCTAIDCTVTGTILGRNAVGGIIGFQNSGNAPITQCVVDGTVSGELNTGGVVGYASAATTAVQDCLVSGTVEGRTALDTTELSIGGLVGIVTTSATSIHDNYCDATVSVNGTEIDRPVVGVYDVEITESTDLSLFDGNSWNRTKFDIDEAMIYGSSGSASGTIGTARNNNLVYSAEDLDYVEAGTVTFISASSLTADGTADAINADGNYKAVANADGTVTLTAYVARIITDNGATTNKYESLLDAYSHSVSGDTIELLADDHSLANGAELFITHAITITGPVDANGDPLYTIYGSSNYAKYNDIFIKGATAIDVTIENVKLSNFGDQSSSNTSDVPGVIWVSAQTHADTHVAVSNVVISSFNYAAIKMYNGKLDVVDCLIDCAKTVPDATTKGLELGAAATASSVTPVVNVIRTEIINNTCDAYDTAAIEAWQNTKLTVSDCTMTNVWMGIYACGSSFVTGNASGDSVSVTVANTLVEADAAAIGVAEEGGTTVPAAVSIQSGTFSGGLAISDEMANYGTFAVSGGLFDDEVPEEYCADGYIPAAQDPDTGLYTVKQGAYVAQNTTTGVKYETLQSALDAVANGQTILVLTNITETAYATAQYAYTEYTDKSFTIDFNGKTVTTAASPVPSRTLFNFVNKGSAARTVTLTNGTITAVSGTYNCVRSQGVDGEDSKGLSDANAPAAQTINIHGMTLNNNYAYGVAIKPYRNTTVDLAGTDITSDIGGNIDVQKDSKVVIHDGTFVQTSGDGATGDSDTCRVNVSVSYGGEAEILGGTFTSSKYGFEVCSSGGTIAISNATATAGGYVLRTTGGNGVIVVADGKFSGNYASEPGDTVSLSGGVFAREPAASYAATGCAVVSNTDPATSAAYPWTVAEVLSADIVYPAGEAAGVPIPLAWATNKTSAVSEGAPVTAADVPGIIDALGQNGANGIPVWQSYVLGLDPKSATATLRLAATPVASDTTKVTVTGVIDTTKFPTIAGTTVTFRLASRNADGTWADIQTGSETPSFEVSLDAVAGKVLAVFADIATAQ